MMHGPIYIRFLCLLNDSFLAKTIIVSGQAIKIITEFEYLEDDEEIILTPLS